MSKHTPGPWITEADKAGFDGCYDVWAGDNILIATVHPILEGEGSGETNAHLIAAGPMLLALAERYRKIVRDPDASLAHWSALTGAFDRAVAEAKGGS